MENTNNDFAESITNAAFETQQSNFDLFAIDSPGPEDEDEDEDKSKDNSGTPTTDDPPIDEEVVHSPLPPQTGGKQQ